MPVLDRSGSARAYDRIRTQIMDLQTENIAELAVRAKSLTDIITLWYGEGDLVTPAFIRDAAKASLDAGNTFYVPDMRGRAIRSGRPIVLRSAPAGRACPAMTDEGHQYGIARLEVHDAVADRLRELTATYGRL